MIKGIIFDCFGVLINNRLHAKIESVEHDDPAAGRAMHDIMRAVDRGMLSQQEYMAQMAEILKVDAEAFAREIDGSVVKNEALIEFIKTLRPNYKVAMLSNVRGRERLEQLFDPGELDQLFEVVVASGDVGIIKPEQEIYELTAQKIALAPEECVLIDDIREYCDGAEAVGMHAIQYKNTKQAVADLETLLDTEKEKY